MIVSIDIVGTMCDVASLCRCWVGLFRNGYQSRAKTSATAPTRPTLLHESRHTRRQRPPVDQSRWLRTSRPPRSNRKPIDQGQCFLDDLSLSLRPKIDASTYPFLGPLIAAFWRRLRCAGACL